mmetsp:Transcript_27811/g.73468  ORF Transcript_27811/g.73468 Transcript_27811/m.73468 type:complete len:382 (+) Transcript_27811:3-1148(+)
MFVHATSKKHPRARCSKSVKTGYKRCYTCVYTHRDPKDIQTNEGESRAAQKVEAVVLTSPHPNPVLPQEGSQSKVEWPKKRIQTGLRAVQSPISVSTRLAVQSIITVIRKAHVLEHKLVCILHAIVEVQHEQTIWYGVACFDPLPKLDLVQTARQLVLADSRQSFIFEVLCRVHWTVKGCIASGVACDPHQTNVGHAPQFLHEMTIDFFRRPSGPLHGHLREGAVCRIPERHDKCVHPRQSLPHETGEPRSEGHVTGRGVERHNTSPAVCRVQELVKIWKRIHVLLANEADVLLPQGAVLFGKSQIEEMRFSCGRQNLRMVNQSLSQRSGAALLLANDDERRCVHGDVDSVVADPAHVHTIRAMFLPPWREIRQFRWRCSR